MVCRALGNESNNDTGAGAAIAHSHADSESGTTLFCPRVWSGVRARNYPHSLGCPTCRHEDGPELMETPIMLAVTIVAAWWTVLRLAVPSVPSSRLGMGCIALVLMLVAEFGFVLWLRGLSIRDCLAT